jgi:phosphoglycolate phosphatase
MRYRSILFDFDGTLADSYPLFLRAYGEVAERHGLARVLPEELQTLRGLSPRRMIEHVGMPMWKLPLVAADFIAFMRRHVSEVGLFPGIESVLQALDDAGLHIAIVSSNAEDNLRAVLGASALRHVRHIESGMSLFGKAGRIQHVLRRSRVAAGQALYVGDQISDHDGAREAGVDFGAVSWGYGCADSLRAARPEWMFEHVDDLRALLDQGAA